MPKSISYASIESRAATIAKQTGKDETTVTYDLVAAHKDRGFEIDYSPLVASDRDLNFANGGNFNPDTTQPLPVRES